MHAREAPESLGDAWDAFVRASPSGSFLQSWAWGVFQAAAGFPVRRVAVWRDETAGELEATCMVLERSLPLQRMFLYAPWGPVLRVREMTEGLPAALPEIMVKLREALGGRGVFFRLEPRILESFRSRQHLGAAGFVFPGRSIQPRDTRIVDLTLSEDKLLSDMHPKTRYNIRLARRHGVVVEEQTNEEGLGRFLALAHDVQERGKFHYHPDAYYHAMARTLGPPGMFRMLVARHQGMPLAAHILLTFGDTVTYAHGATSSQRKQVMAPYLLQWEGMLRAKAEGYARYDLFGIAPPHAPPTHPWFGITRFKAGFGGAEEHYLGAADFVVDQPFYRLYEIGRSLRGLLR